MEGNSQKAARTEIRRAMVNFIIRERREWSLEDDIVFDVIDNWVEGRDRKWKTLNPAPHYTTGGGSPDEGFAPDQQRIEHAANEALADAIGGKAKK